jgi:hypothetical protein
LCAQADADFTYSYGPGADEFAFLDRTKSAPDGEPLEVAPGVAAAAAEAAAWSRTATSQAGKARVWPEHQPPPGVGAVSFGWQRRCRSWQVLQLMRSCPDAVAPFAINLWRHLHF